MVSVIGIRHKVRGFKIFKGDKCLSKTFFGEEVKSGPHVRFYVM
jgi:hypothetical protein